MNSAEFRLGIDATPLLGKRTGVGVYAGGLLTALVTSGPQEVVATAFSGRAAGRLRASVPVGVATRHRPVPAQLLRRAWAVSEFPPLEWLVGRVDVFHATNFVLPPARRARGVVTVHDLAFVRHPDTVAASTLDYRTLVPRSVRRARVVCTPSHAVAAEVFDEYGIEAAAIVVTSPGIDPAWFTARPPTPDLRARLRLPAAGPYVLAIGTLEPRKNLNMLLDAHEAAWHAGLGAPLVLVGAYGWGAPPAIANRPAGSVIVTGYLSDPEVRAVTAGAAALAFPSRYEGFGLPPLQALAAGVPVVATDLAVTREVLGDAANFVGADDRDGWTAALLDVVGEGAWDGGRGRAQARRYTWEQCARSAQVAYAKAWA